MSEQNNNYKNTGLSEEQCNELAITVRKLSEINPLLVALLSMSFVKDKQKLITLCISFLNGFLEDPNTRDFALKALKYLKILEQPTNLDDLLN